MRCCVPGCKNDSKYLSKSQGITFHSFPTVHEVRQSWINVIGKKNWQPKDRSAVCSNHFSNDDLYMTKSGLRKVKHGAVPYVDKGFQVTHNFEDDTPQICRICLITTNKCFSMKDYNLDQAYEQLTGILINEEERLPQSICNVCVHVLNKYNAFRQTTIQANSLLLDIIRKTDCITPKSLSQNTEINYNVLTKFNTELIKEHNFNIEYIETEIKHEDQDIGQNTDSKLDNFTDSKLDHFTDSNLVLDQYADSSSELVEYTHEPETSGIFTNEIKQYNEIESENFDSEDSLPLQICKKKKKIEPKIDRRRKPILNSDLNETLFDIIDLSYEEQIAEIERRQESDNYKNAVFKCTECYKGFLDQVAFKSHMVRHTNESGEHKCKICKTHFKQSHALRKHITAHHTQKFRCKQCEYVTTHRQTARLHERWHRGTKYQCPHCLEDFVKFTTYMGHIRIKHPSDFVCGLCGYSFVSEKGIELHKKLKHRTDIEIPPDGPYCEPCNVRFLNEEAYQKHVSISPKHENKNRNDSKINRKNRRKDREKSTMDGDDKRQLHQTRKVEGPIPCEQCGLQLEDSRAYHGHFRRMHPDKNRTKYPAMKTPCLCELCGRIFQSHALLKDHRWVHTGERPFKCDQCDKSFRMKQRLVAHKHVHSSVKTSYVCNVCGKDFSSQSNRRRHMFIHTGLRPFKCEMCGKGFKHVSEKRAHITYVHLKKPWPKRSRGKRRDIRQGSPSQHMASQDMDLSIWSTCDPKLTDINIMENKPVYL